MTRNSTPSEDDHKDEHQTKSLERYTQKLDQLFDPAVQKPIHFNPGEFLRLTIENQGIDMPWFSTQIMGKYERYCLENFRRAPKRLPTELIGKLVELSTAAPFNSPLFWQQTEFKVSSTDDVPKLDVTLRQIPGLWSQTSTGIRGIQPKINYVLSTRDRGSDNGPSL